MNLSESKLSPAQSHILELPLELREQIYAFLITPNKLIIDCPPSPPRLWEMRCSHCPSPELLIVNHQISAEYIGFAKRVFNKAKLLISTNALTSPLPEELIGHRARAFFELVPYVTVQTLADSKWWITFFPAPWPHSFILQLFPLLRKARTLEFICRLIGDSMFFPHSHLQNLANSAANLRSFFEWEISRAGAFDPKLPEDQFPDRRWNGAGKLKVVKTLILEARPFERIHGDVPGVIHLLEVGNHYEGVFRNLLNRCGAGFSQGLEWFQESEKKLEPLLAERSKAFVPKMRYVNRPVGEMDMVSHAAVYSVVEDME